MGIDPFPLNAFTAALSDMAPGRSRDMNRTATTPEPPSTMTRAVATTMRHGRRLRPEGTAPPFTGSSGTRGTRSLGSQDPARHARRTRPAAHAAPDLGRSPRGPSVCSRPQVHMRTWCLAVNETGISTAQQLHQNSPKIPISRTLLPWTEQVPKVPNSGESRLGQTPVTNETSEMVSKVHGYAVAGTKRPTPGSRRTVGRV